ncbi:MAG: acetylglutamate kinase [Acidimicrobiia bacterium]
MTALAEIVAGLDANAKAGVLVEALPYIRRFAGKVVVVKYGGNAMAVADGAGDELALFAEDVVLLHSVGIRVVVVHGGGPQIGDLLGRLGMESRFVDGLRVTDAETLDVVRMVLVGKVNRELVSAVNVHGPLAVGISGEDGHFLRARARSADLGFVGDVHQVDPTLLRRLLDSSLIPVVATIAMDAEGQAYNVNADAAAGAIAAALDAEKVVYLTDVEGIRSVADDPSTLLSTVSVAELDALVADGGITGGMIPKVASCTDAVKAGVGQAHVLDGRVPHVLLLEIFTRSGIGTMVTP